MLMLSYPSLAAQKSPGGNPTEAGRSGEKKPHVESSLDPVVLSLVSLVSIFNMQQSFLQRCRSDHTISNRVHGARSCGRGDFRLLYRDRASRPASP